MTFWATMSLVLAGTADTTLMAFFKMNATEGLSGDVSRKLLYHEMPRFFTWTANKSWKLRSQNDGKIGTLGSFQTVGSKAALEVFE